MESTHGPEHDCYRLEGPPRTETIYAHTIGAAVVLILFDVIGACLPALVARLTNPLWLTSLTCFGGGSLLALALLDILPHSAAALRSLGTGTFYYIEWSYLLHLLGFAALWCIESILGHQHGDFESTRASFLTHKAQEHKNGKGLLEEEPIRSIEGAETRAKLSPACNATAGCSHHHGIDAPAKGRAVKLTALIWNAIGLVVHAFCEGVLVGNMRTPTSLWLLVVSILGHKWTEAFCIVTAFLCGGASQLQIWLAVLALAVATVLGVAVGAISSVAGVLHSQVLAAIGNGTIFYVGCQLLFEEQHRHLRLRPSVLRAVAFLFGVITVAVAVAVEHKVACAVHHHH